jgi:hypothetical protein
VITKKESCSCTEVDLGERKQMHHVCNRCM